MFLHITFSDGCQPYIKHGTEKQLRREIEHWKENYNIINEERTNTGDYLLYVENKTISLLNLLCRSAMISYRPDAEVFSKGGKIS